MSSEERIIERLISGSKSFACGGFIQSLNGFQQQEIYTDLYFDRLKRKLEHIRNTLHRYNNDWAQTAYYMLLRSMDVGRNRPCYEKLADTLPLKVIQRECISAENIESLLLGASGLKILKFIIGGVTATGGEIALLLVGIVVSFLVSLFAIRFLMDFVKRHDFSVFGIYRIVLGVAVVAYFLLAR